MAIRTKYVDGFQQVTLNRGKFLGFTSFKTTGGNGPVLFHDGTATTAPVIAAGIVFASGSPGWPPNQKNGVPFTALFFNSSGGRPCVVYYTED